MCCGGGLGGKCGKGVANDKVGMVLYVQCTVYISEQGKV